MGVGETSYSRKPGFGKSDLALNLEALVRAISDAGLNPSEIDGIMPFSHRMVTARMVTGKRMRGDHRHRRPGW